MANSPCLQQNIFAILSFLSLTPIYPFSAVTIPQTFPYPKLITIYSFLVSPFFVHACCKPALPQARIVALSVSQGFWGALPGSSFSALAPIHEDVVQVALSGGVVQPGTDKEEGRTRDDIGDRSGGKSDTDRGVGVGAAKGGGVLWLSLPFVAALLPGASPDTRKQAAMSINIVLKVGVSREI